jgi:hypothetical protein
MLVRQLADCAWAPVPAAPRFAPDGLPEGRSAPRNIGLPIDTNLATTYLSFARLHWRCLVPAGL